MLFNSLSFAMLLFVLIAASQLSKGRVRTWLMLLGSWAFYAGWEPKWLVLLWLSTAVDYFAGRWLERLEDGGRRKLVLALSLVTNLGILFAYKYWDFALAVVGMRDWAAVAERQSFHVYGNIPPGLSFYTFQTLSYTIDVYRRKQAAVRDPVDFALYVAFFPQLVAGPIVRAKEFFPQLRNPHPATVARTLTALELFAVGLFKKVVVADNLGLLVDRVYSAPGGQSALALVVASLLFWGQIYADFSGYSTMARGLGKGFGIDLPTNFDDPLLATGPLKYRRSWHTTMSTWFRDYVVHPLGGTKVGPWKVARNILIVWTLFGLWHGAGFTFALWGLYNGVLQALTREYYRRFGPPPDFPGKPVVGWAFNLVLLLPSMIVFRSASLREAGLTMARVLTWSDGKAVEGLAVLALLGFFGLHVASHFFYREDVLAKSSWPTRAALVAAMTWAIVLLGASSRPFVYFQF